MAKYKAKSSYYELDDTKNYNAFGSASKHLWLKESTDYDIRFCFQNARVRISKKSKTTYADWCNQKGFAWCWY